MGGLRLRRPAAYDMEVAPATLHPATTLRGSAPSRNAAYVKPGRRPKDGRYGEKNANRLQHYVPVSGDPDARVARGPQGTFDLKSLQAIGVDAKLHDIRFVGDDWEIAGRRRLGLAGMLWRRQGGVAVHLFFSRSRVRMQSGREASLPMS